MPMRWNFSSPGTAATSTRGWPPLTPSLPPPGGTGGWECSSAISCPPTFSGSWVSAIPLSRFIRLHLPGRPEVGRTLHHHRLRIAWRRCAVVVGAFLPDLGRHLDLRRHVPDFHFALPPLHSIRADDCDVGGENCSARS